jgi:hypothetical protein
VKAILFQAIGYRKWEKEFHTKGASSNRKCYSAYLCHPWLILVEYKDESCQKTGVKVNGRLRLLRKNPVLNLNNGNYTLKALGFVFFPSRGEITPTMLLMIGRIAKLTNIIG